MIIRESLIGPQRVAGRRWTHQPSRGRALLGPEYCRSTWGPPRSSWLNRGHVYPGIELELFSAAGMICRVFYISRLADPNHVCLCIRANGSHAVHAEGYLEISNPQERLTVQPPVAWQMVSGQQDAIPVRYSLDPAESTVGYRIGTYDRYRLLVLYALLPGCCWHE